MTNREWLKKEISNMSDNEIVVKINFYDFGLCENKKCEKSCTKCKLEWLNKEYKEPKPTLSEAERVILENIDKEYDMKWIARDRGGFLAVFNKKPTKDDYGKWQPIEGAEWGYMNFLHHLFQFIKWEDEQAYNIEELLKGNKCE